MPVLRRSQRSAKKVVQATPSTAPAPRSPSFRAGLLRTLAVATNAPIGHMLLPAKAKFPAGFRRKFESALRDARGSAEAGHGRLSRIVQEAEQSLALELQRVDKLLNGSAGRNGAAFKKLEEERRQIELGLEFLKRW